MQQFNEHYHLVYNDRSIDQTCTFKWTVLYTIVGVEIEIYVWLCLPNTQTLAKFYVSCRVGGQHSVH